MWKIHWKGNKEMNLNKNYFKIYILDIYKYIYILFNFQI